MAAIWKGTLTFGLVTIPVELRTAVRSDHISFRQLHKEDHTPIKYSRSRSDDGEKVEWGEIVKGYEYEKGKFVVLTDEDFQEARLATSKTLDVLDFVKADEIDPRYYETPYYLVPVKGGEKAYALLREAVRTTDMVGIGKMIIRQKQHLVAVRAIGDALLLEIMRFASEVVDSSEYSFPPAEGIRPQELKMAQQLVESLAEPFDPTKYSDEYRDNLMRIIEGKMKGKRVRLAEAPEPEDTKVLDLMERLQASLEQSRKGAVRAPKKQAAATQKKTAAKKRRRSA